MTTRSSRGYAIDLAADVFAERLCVWHQQHGRKDLPWQTDRTPYRVWISEIMLQQTQVSTVIGYFDRFMAAFPTLSALATADIDEVTALWTGLGYYARARNLHKAAKICDQHHDSTLPADLELLQALPGIGRSTAGAIAAISMKIPAPILDGNVKRVLCRLAGIREWPGATLVNRQLWQLAEQLTPDMAVDTYTQAIMDLGATLCTRRNPDCERCPFSGECLAHAEGSTGDIPVGKPRKALPEKTVGLMIHLDHEKRIWLEKRPPSGIWGGLWSLPEIEMDPDSSKPGSNSAQPGSLGGSAISSAVRHTFSHYRLNMIPILATDQPDQGAVGDAESGRWCTMSDLDSLGLARPIKNLLLSCFKEELSWQTECIA